MAIHNDIGRRGEDMAASYLQEHGYQILDRNWSNRGRKEVDIIATKDEYIVFVEVKTRRVGTLTSPVAAVDGRKRHRICLAADSYLKTNRIDLRCRFDVIAIIYDGEYSRIDHIEDAFRARMFYY